MIAASKPLARALSLSAVVGVSLGSVASVQAQPTGVGGQPTGLIGEAAARDVTPVVVSMLPLASGAADFALGAESVAWSVREIVQQADLNGDGDLSDDVLFVYDRATQTTHATGLAVSRVHGSNDRLVVDGGYVLALIDEDDAGGTDLNGDGDTGDGVVFAVDVVSGTFVNTGLCVYTTSLHMALSDGVFALLVDEGGQGADLSGDGDQSDHVAFVGSAATGASVPLPWASNLLGRLVLVDGAVLVNAHEQAFGFDATGDGATNDYVLAVHQLDPPVSTLLPGAVGSGFVDLGGGAMQVWAVEDGTHDWNDDGDMQDIVPGLVDVQAPAFVHTGLASNAVLAFDGERLVLAVQESYEGVDLNGDGDTSDHVLHIIAADGTVTNVGLAMGAQPALMRAGRIAWVVPESGQGFADLNGDGFANDHVVHVHDIASGQTLNTGLASPGGMVMSDKRLVLTVSEAAQGFSDLNGDRDAIDHVLHVLDLDSGKLVNRHIGVHPFTPRLQGSAFLMLVEEAAEQRDLTGDGDATDHVTFVLDDDTGALWNFGLAAPPADPVSGPSSVGRTRAFLASEADSLGAPDLNADGDAFDGVLVLVDVKH